MEPPTSLEILGRGCLMQATVVRLKKDLKGENNAREVSDALPFVEYEIHRQLVSFENHLSIYLECYASQHFKFLSNLLRLTKILILNVKMYVTVVYTLVKMYVTVVYTLVILSK